MCIRDSSSEMLVQRRWPQAYYGHLIKMILGQCSHAVVLITGDPREREEAERLKEQVQDERCVNFAGKVSFAQLPQLYSVSEFMVTNDSGPPHFAAITEMPTYVTVSYTHLRAHETVLDLVCRLLLEKKKKTKILSNRPPYVNLTSTNQTHTSVVLHKRRKAHL